MLFPETATYSSTREKLFMDVVCFKISQARFAPLDDGVFFYWPSRAKPLFGNDMGFGADPFDYFSSLTFFTDAPILSTLVGNLQDNRDDDTFNLNYSCMRKNRLRV